MKILTFSDEKYEKERRIHLELSKKYNYEYINKNKNHLINTCFYQKNEKILNYYRGAGLWLWKPYFILEEVLKLNDNQYLIYIDCGDIFSNKIKDYLDNQIQYHDIILLEGCFKNSSYTKRDCFILMNCDSEKYWNSVQIEAGFSVWKKTDFSIKILNEWLNYCCNWDIISDDNFSQNFNDFIDHRHDQSILNNLSIKYNIYRDLYLRNFIECNYKYYPFNFIINEHSRELDKFLLENKNILYES